MNAELNSSVVKGTLSASVVRAVLSQGAVVVNDWLIYTEAIDGGNRIVFKRGSEIHTIDVMDGTAELQGIRAGYNQINYPNAGEAVRGQVSQLSRFTKAAVNLDSEMLNLSDAVFVSGSYIKSDGTIGENGSLKYTEDYFSIAPDWESLTIYRKINLTTTGAETLPSPCAVFYAENGAGATADSANTEHDGDYVTYKIPQWAKTVRFNFGITNPVDIVRINKFKNGKVGEFAGTFTGLNQQLSTGIALRKGQKYLIRKENITDPFNAFIGGYSSNFVRMKKFERDMYFTPTAPGVLTLYNESVFGLLGEVKITVYIADEESKLVEKQPKVYTVGKRSSEYDYTSFTQCLLDLQDDRSPKIIYINEGDYDIYQEYKDAGVPAYTGDSPTYDYFDYCVWIPENTHVIGRGVVRLMWMPDPNEVDLTYNDSAVVSPVNCAGTMTLENVEIHCRNGRYCIHDDPLGNDEFTNAIKKYINVRCYKYANDAGFGFNSTIGFGIDRSMRYEFHNCLFKNEGTGAAFYMHDRKKVGVYNLTEQMGSNVIATNCVIDAAGTTSVKFGNSTSAAHIRVDFNSCWFSGKISCINESSSTTTYPNSWDLKLCLCNNVEINVADPDNLYPPLVYAH